MTDAYLWQGCCLHQSSVQLEAEARCKADRPQHPQRICAQNTAQGVQLDRLCWLSTHEHEWMTERQYSVMAETYIADK